MVGWPEDPNLVDAQRWANDLVQKRYGQCNAHLTWPLYMIADGQVPIHEESTYKQVRFGFIQSLERDPNAQKVYLGTTAKFGNAEHDAVTANEAERMIDAAIAELERRQAWASAAGG